MVGGTLAQAVLFIGWLGGWWYTVLRPILKFFMTITGEML